MKIHLIDLLQEAKVQAPSPNHVDIQRITIQKDSRTAIFQHPDSSILFSKIRLGKSPSLTFSIGINPVVWDRLAGAVHFEIYLLKGFKRKCIFSQKLNPRMLEDDRNWHDHFLDLTPWTDKEIRLQLITSAENHRYAWSCWGNPQTDHQIEILKRKVRSKDHRHIFLITSDALSKRFLGCYGHPFMQTPNIDRLVKQSLQFQEAYSVSSITLGSYASLLTGHSPIKHQLNSEWGALAPELPTHIEAFRQLGYYTACFTGETELSLPEFGFTTRFDESIPNISNPAQDGSITLRSFEKWLDQKEDGPMMCWMQFFDTHPPSLAPVPFNTRYTEKPGLFYPEHPPDDWKVFGVECLVEIEKELPNLEKGLEAPLLCRRLQACATAFRDNRRIGPDVWQHIRQLPAHARRGMNFQDFGRWLESEIVPVREGKRASPEFLNWLHLIRKEIQFINNNITTWLEGTTDFNDAVAQYAGCTSYFDHLMGQLVDILRQQGIFDQSCIIITSPHGEIMQFHDCCFHHHVPHFDVYDIPLIIKLPHQTQKQSVSGIIRNVDTLPTVAGLLGLSLPMAATGGMNLAEYCSQGHLPVRKYAEVFDIHDLTRSIIHSDYLYVKFREDYRITSQWSGKKDAEFLFKRDDSPQGMVLADHPEQLQRMRKMLGESQDSELLLTRRRLK